MKLKQYYVIAICLSLLFGSELSAQKSPTSPHLSGRAVRSSHTPGLSSRRRTELNTQVINSVLKQNTPTKAGQRQISSIERRLRLPLPTIVIGERSRSGVSSITNIWVPGWEGVIGGRKLGTDMVQFQYWLNWLPR